jgi:UDP-2,3-diacylglucosamine hydrolase
VKIFYLSDLHLRSPEEPRAQGLCRFLEIFPQAGDVVIFGGDIFDLFVGNKAVLRQRFADILLGIAGCASRGVEVHYLEGNHDFLLQGVFGDQAGVHLHDGDFSLEKEGVKIWVSHGDLIDPEDRGYRFLRAVTRSLPFRLFLAAVPGSLVGALGEWSSRQSRKYNNAETIDHGRREKIRALYLDFAKARISSGFRHVLIGHSHLPDHVSLSGSGNSGEYLNLGFSSSGLDYAVLEAGDAIFQKKTLS